MVFYVVKPTKIKICTKEKERRGVWGIAVRRNAKKEDLQVYTTHKPY